MEFVAQGRYLPNLARIFADLRCQRQSILPFARVEHIGSSSIPGAISKGDLDIFVGVPQSNFDETIRIVSAINFHEKADTLRTPSLCMMVTDKYLEDVAIQIVANDTEYECFLLFRDKMQSNPELVAEYNRLKTSCRGMSHDEYRQIKSAFIQTILNSPDNQSG